MASDELRVLQTPLFGRQVKKFPKQEKKALEDQIRVLLANPNPGTEKKGDLREIFVHKYRFQKQEMLLEYSFGETEMLLIAIGSHGNHYRDLESYLK